MAFPCNHPFKNLLAIRSVTRISGHVQNTDWEQILAKLLDFKK